MERRVYAHASEQIAFWEGANLAWSRKWDLSCIEEVIIGGDGAKWIREGVEEVPGAIWQPDGFHLARDCSRAYGAQRGHVLYQALRAGEAADIQTQTPPQEGKSARRVLRRVTRVIQEGWGVDWRVRLGMTDETARGLGSMEGNQAHLLADRMKGKGRSWSPDGARHMAKVRELLANDELERWCYRQAPPDKPREHPPQQLPSHHSEPSQWLHASLPILHGPSANAPWVQQLRRIVHPSDLLN